MKSPSFLILLKLLCIASCLSLASAHAAEENGQPESDPSGPVLCVWRLYQALRQAGEICFPDDRFRSSLNDAINRMDRFIMENAPATQAEIDADKRAWIRPLPTERLDRSVLCTSQNYAVSLYERLRGRGAPALDQEMTKLLAVARKPLMNPCL